eukprot:SAG31_NODE_3116_length_4658_cov_2.625576_4_plen_130_part_00
MCSYSSITFTDHPVNTTACKRLCSLGYVHVSYRWPTVFQERSSNAPSCANRYMLNDVLRGEWKWNGYILSDAGATAFVGKTEVGKPGDLWHESNKSFGHGFASSPEDAAVKALSAGLDLELTCCGTQTP